MALAKCLVIGANGLVGRRIGNILSGKKIDWIGTCNKRNEDGLRQLDITDAPGLASIFQKSTPRVVFLCANLAGGVDFCEKNPKTAEDFYLNATKEIGKLCREGGASLVFISTDYVFDGTSGPCKEEDKKNPLNLYGRLKLRAEDWILENLKEYVIVRTTNVFGWDPQTVTPNYMMNLYRTAKAGKPFNAPSFLWGNPTYAGDLALALIELSSKESFGVFHVVGSSFVNRFDWALEACDALGLDRNLVKEVKDPPQNVVPRPLKSRLSTEKFRSSYETILHDLNTGLGYMSEEMRKDGS